MMRRLLLLTFVVFSRAQLSTYRCGTNYLDAVEQCGTECPKGKDTECPTGEQCFEDVVCKTEAPTAVPTPPPPPMTPPAGSLSSLRRCGTSFKDADNKCGTFCPSGYNDDCPEGEYCFTNVKCDKLDPTEEYRCGATYEDATQLCGTPCPGGNDYECPTGESCFDKVICLIALLGVPPETDPTVTPSNRCGTSFNDACGTACPNGTDAECDEEWQYCFSTTFCGSSSASTIFSKAAFSWTLIIMGTILFRNL